MPIMYCARSLQPGPRLRVDGKVCLRPVVSAGSDVPVFIRRDSKFGNRAWRGRAARARWQRGVEAPVSRRPGAAQGGVAGNELEAQ